MIGLAPGTAHVWLTPAGDFSDSRRKELENLLTREELDRAQRFVFQKDRMLFVAARAHIRRVLSLYAPVEPQEWRFRSSALGRPFIDNTYDGLPLFFSLSHTAGMVSSLITLTERAGIDAENMERESDCEEIARHAFSAAEYQRLAALRGEEQRRRFYELWTLKEAYSKARGAGLSIGFDRMVFDTSEAEIKASFENGLDDHPNLWHFELARPTPMHQLAIAIKEPGCSVRAEIRFFPL